MTGRENVGMGAWQVKRSSEIDSFENFHQQLSVFGIVKRKRKCMKKDFGDSYLRVIYFSFNSFYATVFWRKAPKEKVSGL